MTDQQLQEHASIYLDPFKALPSTYLRLYFNSLKYFNYLYENFSGFILFFSIQS